MKPFEPIDPLTIAEHPNLLATLPDDEDERVVYYLLLVDDYVIIANTTDYVDPDTSEQEWLHYQIEFPKLGLQWFLDALENQFFMTEAEGCLPRGLFHYEGKVGGERLKLGRAFDVGGECGYVFITLDRKETWGQAKAYSFTDTFLFDHGMIDLMKEIAAKIQRGEL